MALERAFEAASIFGLSALEARAISGRPLPEGLGLVIPLQIEDVPAPSHSSVLFDRIARRELAAQIEAHLSPLEPHVAVLDAVRSLTHEGACCVVATVSPGVFGGPLSTSFQALHLARLARDLSAFWNKPVIPVLWNQADDAPPEDATSFINGHLDLVKSAPAKPLTKDTLADLLEHEPYTADAIELALPQDGESVARAFTRFHVELFGHLGVVVIEPDWLRSSLSESLAELVSPTPMDALTSASQRFARAGFDQAFDPATAPIAHLVQNETRQGLRAGGDGWRFIDEPGSRTSAELAAEIIADKPAYSCGALLHPLVLEATLPIAAHIGNGQQLAAHAQLAELRKERGLGPGVFVPAACCTLTDARARKSMAVLDQTLGQFVAASRVDSTPPKNNPDQSATQIADGIRQATSQLFQDLADQRAKLQDFDPTMAAQLKRTTNSAKRNLDELADRIANASANSRAKNRRHQRRLDALLFPGLKPQQDALTTCQMVARFGRGWIDQLLEAIESLPTEHLVAHIDPHAVR